MTWRLGVGLFAFVVWAPPALVALPCAALLALAPDRAPATKTLAAVLGVAGAALLTFVGGGPLGAATRTFVLLVTVAFALGVALWPTDLLRQALRAAAVAAAVTALLVQLVWGAEGWGALAWQATRDTGLVARLVMRARPESFTLFEPVVRFVSATVPGMLVLQSIAGLALAWECHTRLAHPPLGAPLARFREFRIGDGWVWGIVAWLGILAAPVSGALKVVGANLGLVLGTLYVLRGAAIVVTFAQAAGVTTVVLLVAAGVAAGLAVPLLFVLPGLATLGITDTWYQYRRRLAAPKSNA